MNIHLGSTVLYRTEHPDIHHDRDAALRHNHPVDRKQVDCPAIVTAIFDRSGKPPMYNLMVIPDGPTFSPMHWRTSVQHESEAGPKGACWHQR